MQEKTFVKHLKKILQGRKKTIYFTERKLNDDHIKRLCDTIRKQNTIEEIHLAGNEITDKGLAELMTLVREKTNITKVTLARNKITNNQELNKFYNVLANRRKTEKKLDLESYFTRQDKKKDSEYESGSNYEYEIEHGNDYTNEQAFDDYDNDDDDRDKEDPLEGLDWKEAVQKIIEYQFKQPGHLEQVRWVHYNQGLESLGDALFDVVLGLYHGIDEVLAENAELIKTRIAKILKHNLIVPQSTSKTRHGDATEALLGAVFLDSKFNHKIVEQAALKIWGVFCLWKILKAKPEGLGVALRKLGCVYYVLSNSEKQGQLANYCSTVEKDNYIHLLATYNSKLTAELTLEFVKSYHYPSIFKMVETAIKEVVKLSADTRQTIPSQIAQTIYYTPGYQTYTANSGGSTLRVENKKVEAEKRQEQENASGLFQNCVIS